jgi:DNA polymerase III epsilon subunit-like protein
MDRPLVFLDTETATLFGAPHLLELAAIRVEGGEVVDRYDTLVRPQVPVEEGVTAIHGIRDEDVREAPDAGTAVGAFASWLGDTPVAAHGARIDAGVLAFECVRFGLSLPAAPMIDTVKLARELLPDAPDHRLQTLCQILDVETTVYHRALPDAVSCWKVLEACVERLPPERERTFDGLLALHGSPITIAGSKPRAPKIVPRLRPLEEACRNGSRLSILYGEESGLARLSVSPKILFESKRRGYMEGECARSGLLKTYRLDRIHKIFDD